jgi:hypothetical protein
VQRSVQGWYAVSIVLAGAFMALLHTTIVNVALPTRSMPPRDAGTASLLLALASRALLTAAPAVPDDRVRSS